MIRPAAPLVALLLSGAAAAASGQPPAGPAAAAPARHDSNAPVDWEADRIEVQDAANRAIFVGNVRVRQAEMTLTADRVTALYTGQIAGSGGGASPRVTRLDASGNVVVNRPGEVARGNYAIDDLNARLITLIGNVSLDRNGSVVRGGRLVIDQNTNRATVDGSAVAAGQGKGGRVSGRFIVDDAKPK